MKIIQEKPMILPTILLDALRDGWRLIQMSPLLPPIPGKELQTSILNEQRSEKGHPSGNFIILGGLPLIVFKVV